MNWLSFPYCDRDYQVGSEIKLRLQDLEATGHFLGQSKRITMCEADAKLAKNWYKTMAGTRQK